jgi:hypothetical protein
LIISADACEKVHRVAISEIKDFFIELK